MDTLLILLISSFAAILAANWVFPKVLRMAKTRNLVDAPDTRKLQREPVPVMGGLTVSFGAVVGIFLGLVLSRFFGSEILQPDIPLVLAMVAMLLVGAIDDVKGLSPLFRFVVEILVVLGIIFSTDLCIDTFHGLWGVDCFTWWWAVPFTVIAGVGIINAVNMIDGVNGLSSSYCVLCSLIFGSVFAQEGDYALSIINFTMAASLLPFMIHNVIGLRSKMFIGDSGTMVMGVLISYDTIRLLSSSVPENAGLETAYSMSLPAMVLSLLAVPVGDTLRVMMLRIARHQSPFQGDKTHLHHILMDYSHSHTLTTLTEILIVVLIILVWLCSYLLGCNAEGQFYAVLLSSILLVWGCYGYLAIHRTERAGLPWYLRQLFARMRQGETAWWSRMQERVDGRHCK